jgi:hypothetical protein
MRYAVMADITVLIHALFVLFVVFGGVAALRWKRLLWFHLPAVIWGGAIELLGWVCPLTYLENFLRRLGGEAGYRGTFIEQYLEPVLYPLGMARHSHIILGLSAIFINLVIYRRLWRRSRKR